MHRSWRGPVALVLGVVAARVFLVAQVPLGDDEAYYWLWSQRPDLGYFDHPGGIAWLIGLTTAVFGDGPGAVRLPVVLAGGGLALAVGAAVPPERRMWATALALFVPVLGLIGVFAAPDAPFLLLWFLTAALARGLDERPTPARWAVVGAGVGATLCFKLTGVLLAAGLVLWSLTTPARRRWWTTSGPWLAIGAMGLVASPTAAWNWLNDWPTVRFHAVGRHAHTWPWWMGLGVWAAVHLVLLTPPLVWAIWRGRGGRSSSWLWMAAPAWVVFSVGALITPSKVHWWAPAWVTVLPVAVGGLQPRLARITLAGLVLLHIVVLGSAVAPLGILASATAELRGWTDLAHLVHEQHPEATAWVTPRYQTSAQLAWGARALDRPPVLRITGRADQFTVWGDDQLPTEGLVVLVCASHLPCRPADLPGLDCPLPATTEPVHHSDGRVLRTFSVWRCQPQALSSADP